MQEIPALAPVYLAHAPPSLGGSGAPLTEELEPLLRELAQTAQAAWPGVPLSPQDFAAHLSRHTPEGSAPERLLHSLYVEDLYLACACAQGVPEALHSFEERFLSRVANWLPPGAAQQGVADETRQVLREKLMVGTRPRIAEYSGKGPLLSWLRVVALRVAADLRRQRHGAQLGDEDDPALQAAALAAGGGPELEVMKERCWEDFKHAFAAAVSSLPSEERAVLRLYYIQELTQDEIARMLRVERSTVSRWVAKVRRTIFEETRRRLRERIGLSAEEFDSMVRLIRSHFDSSMARLLKLDDPR